MAVRIRLTRVGATKQPTYRLVVADSRSARDSRSLETIGHYNPRTDPIELKIDAERAMKWLETVQGPFFSHIAWTIPHANNELGRDTGNGMEVPEDAPYSGKPWPQVEKNFAAMISRMDRDMGRLMELLRRRGLDENTLVLFTSDNGPHKEGGHDACLLYTSPSPRD